jgi:putative hydrolase of the HAD superfamily
MNIRAVVFDLDDTLYEELDFFRSGFAEVARRLEARGVGPAAAVVDELLAIHLHEGRERVLDTLAARRGFPLAWVPELRVLFSSHRPSISLAPDVAGTLDRLRGRYALGCITDGWPAVQRGKVEALGLASAIDTIVYAGDFGRDRWKPSVFPFALCCTTLKVAPAEVLYVGDHPERDVRGARAAGMASARIRRERGYFRDLQTEADHADHEICSLTELLPLLEAGPS